MPSSGIDSPSSTKVSFTPLCHDDPESKYYVSQVQGAPCGSRSKEEWMLVVGFCGRLTSMSHLQSAVFDMSSFNMHAYACLTFAL